MLTQEQADRLIAMLKEAIREDTLIWMTGASQDEFLRAVDDGKLQFILSLSRNPFEIRLHCRTRDRNIGLARVDNACLHTNPDGREIAGKPHLHLYRAGYGNTLPWAEPVDWYDVSKPVWTLERFLDVVHARFGHGIQLELL